MNAHLRQRDASWYEEKGVIYVTFTISEETTGQGWIKRDIYVSQNALNVLCSKSFTSCGPGTYTIAILKGSLFTDNDRCGKEIRLKAKEMHLLTPRTDLACLLHMFFTHKDIERMGIAQIVTMHEPIVKEGVLYLLTSDRLSDGRILEVRSGDASPKWDMRYGFAFLESKSF